MIYVASPYSKISDEHKPLYFDAAFRYTSRLMKTGRLAFSPIVYGHQFYINGQTPADHVWWQDFNERILLGCTQMHVLCLRGWEDSAGIAHEIDFCDRHGIHISYIEPACYISHIEPDRTV